MESPTPVSRYVHQNSKKRVLPVGASSSMCEDVEVLEFLPPINRSSKSSRKTVNSREVIDVDTDDDSGDVMIVDPDPTVSPHRNGKEAMHDFSLGLAGLPSDGYGSDVQPLTSSPQIPHDSIDNDDINSVCFFGDDDCVDNYYDDITYDECSLLESHFDHMDIPSGIEAPFPWLPSSPKNKSHLSVSSTAINSSSQLQSVNVKASSCFGSSSSWLSPIIQATRQSTSGSKPSSGTQANTINQHPMVKFPFRGLESSLNRKKSTSSDRSSILNLQSPMGAWNPNPGNEPFHNLGRGKRRSQASHAVFSDPSNHFSIGGTFQPINANYSGNYLKLNLPTGPAGVSNYMSQWPGLPPNIPGTSLAPWGFTEFVPWAGDAANSQNGTSATCPSVPVAKVQRNMDEVLQNFQTFRKFDTVEDYLDHHYSKDGNSAKRPPKNWSKKIQEEWKILEKDLPDTIFVRVYEARMDLLRAVIVGAEGTPYHDGLFFFDVSFPSSYPNVPPLVHYHSGGLRINPNLYAGGKVCLSLLNTWAGSQKEKWIPGVSTMLQVLVSIQGLILNAKPYFNEPGYANTSGTKQGKILSLEYNESTFIHSLQTMMYSMRRPPKHFEDFVVGHYCMYARDILVSCKAYLDGAQVGCLTKGGVQDVDEGDNSCSQHFKCSLASFLPTLVNTFLEIGAKDCEEFLSPSKKASSEAPAAAAASRT